MSVPWSGTAVAHGSVADPASRGCDCRLRRGSDFQNPAMAHEDPLCRQAWQDNPNAMRNWNGLYRNGSAGDSEAVIPDGRLCSGGRTEGGRSTSMDTAGAWRTTDVDSDLTVRLHDRASHGADSFLVYVTRQGPDPTTQPLTWNDLEPVATTGSYGPGRNHSIPVSTSGCGGRHVVHTIRQASPMDRTYFPCSDVDFG